MNEKLKELEDFIVTEIEKLAHSVKTRMHHLMHPEVDAAKNATLDALRSKLAEFAPGATASASDSTGNLPPAPVSSSAVGAATTAANPSVPLTDAELATMAAATANLGGSGKADDTSEDKNDPTRGQFIG